MVRTAAQEPIGAVGQSRRAKQGRTWLAGQPRPPEELIARKKAESSTSGSDRCGAAPSGYAVANLTRLKLDAVGMVMAADAQRFQRGGVPLSPAGRRALLQEMLEAEPQNARDAALQLAAQLERSERKKKRSCILCPSCLPSVSFCLPSCRSLCPPCLPSVFFCFRSCLPSCWLLCVSFCLPSCLPSCWSLCPSRLPTCLPCFKKWTWECFFVVPPVWGLRWCNCECFLSCS